MNRGKILLSILAVLMLLMTSLGTYGQSHTSEFIYSKDSAIAPLGDIPDGGTFVAELPTGIEVTDSHPFYALIATPLAVHYDNLGDQEVIPLYVMNLDDPSKAVERAKDQIGIPVNLTINGTESLKNTSLNLAMTYWDSSDSALIIKDDAYDLGVVATPIASYLSIPVIVTDGIDQDVNGVLDYLGVEHVYICGDLDSDLSDETFFTNIEQIIEECIEIIDDRLGETVEYITMTNPADITMPEVLDTETEHFDGTVGSSVVLPTQFINSIIKQNGAPTHTFTIPSDYKYCQLVLDLENENVDDVDELDDRMFGLIYNPDGNIYVYTNTGGSASDRDGTGSIVGDKTHYEITIYNEPGEYELMILGQFFASIEGDYDATITMKKLDSPIVPLMRNLSSIVPYLTAYHKGIVFARPEFAFAADDDVIYNGTTCNGVTQPGTNPNLIEPSNNHTMEIHAELLEILGQIAGISVGDLEDLRDHYAENPIYIAIAADPTMVPMYFYHNPDGMPNQSAHIMGFALPSDFMYGDIDPKPDDPENNTYTYWPFQENIVGRVTGRDVQDCSALIARTIYYDEIIDDLGSWKDNALVQTGCGLEFQNLPIATRLSHVIYGGRGEPTKFPTGESKFINMRLQEGMAEGEYDVTSTRFTESARKGFSDDELDMIKDAGILNKLLFPKNFVKLVNSDETVIGGEAQLNSSLIFAFAHGIFNLYEFGDILMDCRGFPFMTALARIYPTVGSRLSTKGTFDVRSVENMEYGPSVIYVESCITARTDGIIPENTLSQTYIHAGVNTYIGATRVTADPGYLEPRPLPNGLGIGLLGYLNATLRYQLTGELPEAHFGAVIAEGFIDTLIDDDASVGRALRDAKNQYLGKDANTTFLWSPPLTLSSQLKFIDDEYLSSLPQTLNGMERTRVLDKKYVALHEFALYGDPAFNPYQPKNNG